MKKRSGKSTILGIDLGTTNSLVSYIRNDSPEIIANERGSRLTSSVVTFKDDHTVLVGELAKNQIVVNRETTISNVKREMGNDNRYRFHNREFTPVECSSLILRKLKGYAEDYLGEPADEAVITVPAYFNDRQRQATLKAGSRAGLNVLKLLNEPTAAALAYGFFNKGAEHLLVFDLGGGTLDITFMEYENNLFKVKGTGGSTNIGGIDFDGKIAGYIMDTFEKQHSVSLRDDQIVYQQVLINSERAKCDLSAVEETTIFIPYIAGVDEGPLHIDITITRKELERLIKPYLEKISNILADTFAEAKVERGWVNSIIFVGGSTRIPRVRELVVDTVNEGRNGDGVAVYNDLNPDEVVALGAGVLSGIFSGEIPYADFYDITSHDLGIEDNTGKFVALIPKGTRYPCEVTKLFTTTENDQSEVTIRILQNGINGETGTNVSLGEFNLSKIPRAPAGNPNIDVKFSIDRHGIMNISALNLETGDREEIVISGHDWLIDDTGRDRRGSGVEII